MRRNVFVVWLVAFIGLVLISSFMFEGFDFSTVTGSQECFEDDFYRIEGEVVTSKADFVNRFVEITGMSVDEIEAYYERIGAVEKPGGVVVC